MNAALAGLVILLIGDSHIAATGFFNNPLHNALVLQGATVHSFGVCAADAGAWITPAPIVCGRGERHNLAPAQINSEPALRGWALPDLIRTYSPNMVIVELGDTMAGYGLMPALPRQLISDQVNRLLAPIKARNLPCIWIGPPWGNDGGVLKKTNVRVKEISDYLPQVVSPCRYIDSLSFAQPGQWETRDGVHLTMQATQVWDNHLVRSIDQIVSKETLRQ